MSNLVDSIIIFRILKKLTTPWEKTKAFQTGLIDKQGKILVKKKDRTSEQKAAFTLLDRLVFNMKRLIAKVPGGKTQIGSYVAALALIKEYVEKEANEETAKVLVEKMEEQEIIPRIKHDLSNIEGFLDAFEEEFMREMNSGAGIGGAFDGAQSNAAANATGMAAPTGRSSKKRKGIEKVLQRRL